MSRRTGGLGTAAAALACLILAAPGRGTAQSPESGNGGGPSATAPLGEATRLLGGPSGAPTVVFEAGLGSPLAYWGDIPDRTAAFATAFAYNRAGYAETPLLPSDEDGIRTSDEAARRLRALLERSGLPGPYVLVGHSLGTLYVLKFAELYPADVAAIILLDGRLKGFTGQCQALGGCQVVLNPPPEAPPAIRAELRGIPASEAMTPEPEALGDIPVTVISRTTNAEPLDRLWADTQRSFASRLRHGRLIVAPNSGHNVQRDAPDLVMAEIRAAVDRTRR